MAPAGISFDMPAFGRDLRPCPDGNVIRNADLAAEDDKSHPGLHFPKAQLEQPRCNVDQFDNCVRSAPSYRFWWPAPITVSSDAPAVNRYIGTNFDIVLDDHSTQLWNFFVPRGIGNIAENHLGRFESHYESEHYRR